MASPFQQQVRQRKILYIGLIIVLFTLSMLWRRNVTDGLAERLAIREESRGEVELLGAVARLGLTGSRGLVTCVLWNNAMEKQKKNQWNELEVLVRSLTRLQPHFITPWLFQSWNLAYNVSVESDRVRDKYFYVSRGVELLAEGERQNRNHPDLRWSIGFYLQHKICKSDETNYLRSLFQLSLIPPNERDPARFWKESSDGPVFNWIEFQHFCTEHPQLVRRLYRGVHPPNIQEKKRLFLCERAEDVVEFLEDNWNVPSLYVVQPLPADVPSQTRGWLANRKDTLLDPEQRFPCLPPEHADAFDRTALSSSSTLHDDTDGYAVAQAWFAYSQEPLPLPGPLPGSSEEITDPAHQRRPKNMTTLIFRHYPAMARRFMAERLQEEGWYDGEGWDVLATDLFRDSPEAEHAGKQLLVGAGVKWSQDAWTRAFAAWEDHGQKNHLLFESAPAEQTKRALATRFAENPKYRMAPLSSPPRLDENQMSEELKREYEAAQFMYEYQFYRTLTNFPHHYIRALVESKPTTVLCKKMFYKAEQANLFQSPVEALRYYQTPVLDSLNPLQLWRDRVLLTNEEFRRDSFTQETGAEIQLRYLILWNRYDGLRMKEKLVKMAPLIPLMPKFNPDDFRPPIVEGPFDVNDPSGQPLIGAEPLRLAYDRMGFKRQPSAPPANEPTRQPLSPPNDK